MNLRYQSHAEAAEEVREAIEDEETWLTLQEVAELVDIDAEEDAEGMRDLQMILRIMAGYGKVQRMKLIDGGALYRV